jgi:hypothetical protein
MSSPLDVRRNLDHCMQNIKGAREAMEEDLHEAAMRLGAAEMTLASASLARSWQPKRSASHAVL